MIRLDSGSPTHANTDCRNEHRSPAVQHGAHSAHSPNCNVGVVQARTTSRRCGSRCTPTAASAASTSVIGCTAKRSCLQSSSCLCPCRRLENLSGLPICCHWPQQEPWPAIMAAGMPLAICPHTASVPLLSPLRLLIVFKCTRLAAQVSGFVPLIAC